MRIEPPISNRYSALHKATKDAVCARITQYFTQNHLDHDTEKTPDLASANQLSQPPTAHPESLEFYDSQRNAIAKTTGLLSSNRP